jgi:hypothetical protein
MQAYAASRSCRSCSSCCTACCPAATCCSSSTFAAVLKSRSSLRAVFSCRNLQRYRNVHQGQPALPVPQLALAICSTVQSSMSQLDTSLVSWQDTSSPDTSASADCAQWGTATNGLKADSRINVPQQVMTKHGQHVHTCWAELLPGMHSRAGLCCLDQVHVRFRHNASQS